MNRVTMMLAAGLVFLAAASLPIMRAGALQAVVTEDNLDQTIASAKTPADHEAICVTGLRRCGTKLPQTTRSLPRHMRIWPRTLAAKLGQEISDGQGGRVTALLVHQSFLGLQACAGCG